MDIQMETLDMIIIVIYLIGTLAFGLLHSKNIGSIKDFAISDKGYGALVIFATLSASYIGGGFSTGNASKVFIIGTGNIVVLWGFSLKEILVGKFIVPKMNRFKDVFTTGGIIRKAYDRGPQIITGFFSVLLCAGILAAQVGAMGYIFNLFLGIDEIYGIIIGLLIVITYSTFGGMKAVIATDVIQFWVLAIGIPLALIFGISEIGGIDALIENVPKSHFDIFNDKSIIAFISLFLSFLLGETLVPPYVQRLLIGKNIKSTQKGTILSGVFSILFFAITGLIGLVALALYPQIESDFAMPMVIKNVLPVGLSGIVIAGMISIVMSSADSFINGAATSAVQDIIDPIYEKNNKSISDKSKLKIARFINAITGILAVIVTLLIPNVLDILLFAYNFWAPVILIPLLLAILNIKVTKKAFYVAVICGIVSTVLWKRYLMDITGLDGMIVGIFANFVGFTIANKGLKVNK